MNKERWWVLIAACIVVYMMFYPLLNGLIAPGLVPLIPFAVAGIVSTVRNVRQRRMFKDDIDRELADMLKAQN